jgi:hypothetical protein
LDAVKKMRNSACSADVVGFFSRIDRGSTLDNLIAHDRTKREESVAKLDMRYQAAVRKGWDEAETNLPDVMADIFRGWEEDIRRGSSADFCHMSIVDSTESDGSADVHWRTPSGKDRTWRLARGSGRWLVVRINQN